MHLDSEDYEEPGAANPQPKRKNKFLKKDTKVTKFGASKPARVFLPAWKKIRREGGRLILCRLVSRPIGKYTPL